MAALHDGKRLRFCCYCGAPHRLTGPACASHRHLLAADPFYLSRDDATYARQRLATVHSVNIPVDDGDNGR